MHSIKTTWTTKAGTRPAMLILAKLNRTDRRLVTRKYCKAKRKKYLRKQIVLKFSILEQFERWQNFKKRS